MGGIYDVSRARKPMAQRTLTLHNGDDRADVRVRMWAPVRFGQGYVCDLAIDGLPSGPVRTHAAGVDSLQALVLALQCIYSLLEPSRDRLSLWDEPGSTGIPYMVSHFLVPEQRRLEQLVKDETERSAIDFNANHPSTARSEQDRRRYDPNGDAADYAARSTPELVGLLRAAAARADAYFRAGNMDAWAVFYGKQTDVLVALGERPELEAVLLELADSAVEAERPVRYRAAELLLWKFNRPAELERLAAEATGPEAKKARKLVDLHAREAARRKPWDNEDASVTARPK